MLSEGGIVLDKVKIAVIDNGVVEKVLRHPWNIGYILTIQIVVSLIMNIWIFWDLYMGQYVP